MSTNTDAQLLGIFRIQAGIITSHQALAIGLSRRQIRYRLQTGRWLQLRRGVYRHGLFDESELMWVHALSIGGSGYASHRYAARLHGLEPYDRATPELTVRRRSIQHVPPTIRIHESTQVDTADITTIDGLPVSGIERTIMDVAATERRQWAILAAIDSAVRQQKTDAFRLDHCLKLHARRGRDGTVRFRKALEQFNSSDAVPIGHASRRAAAIVHSSGVPRPSFEDRVYVNGEFIAQTDLAWEVPLVGFIDGFTHHGSRRQQTTRDRHQRQTLRSSGLVVLEFTYDQLSDPSFVVTTTRSAHREALVRVRKNRHRYRDWYPERRLY
jgi:hypothetical protein